VTGIRHDDVSTRVLAKLVLAAAVLLLAITLLGSLAPLGAQIVVASFIAIALDTVARHLERRGMRRSHAVLTVLLAVFAMAIVAALIVVQPLVDGLGSLSDTAPDVVQEVEQSSAYSSIADSLHLDGDLLDAIKDQLVKLPGALVDATLGLVGNIFGLVNMVLMVIFLITGGQAAVAFAIRLWPRLGAGSTWVVITGAYRSIGQYLIGATLQATFAAASLAIVLWLLGTPYVLPLALLMFLLDYVPLVGATLASIPAVAVTLFAEGTGPALAMTAFLIIYQQVENAIIQPRIQGQVVNLPVIAIFFSVMVGGQLFGVAGALLAVPCAAIAAIGINEWLVVHGRGGFMPERVVEPAVESEAAST
jgi:predicted PurR-regulated permease PerM